MAWRPMKYLVEGELDNTRPGRVTGWMKFAGVSETVTFDLLGDFHRDIRGAKIRLTGDAWGTRVGADAKRYMRGFALRQTGKVGDITAGLPPQDYVGYPYIEWYSHRNGRIVLELQPAQVRAIGTPIPADQSKPVSRRQQNDNVIKFLCAVAGRLERLGRKSRNTESSKPTKPLKRKGGERDEA